MEKLKYISLNTIKTKKLIDILTPRKYELVIQLTGGGSGVQFCEDESAEQVIYTLREMARVLEMGVNARRTKEELKNVRYDDYPPLSIHDVLANMSLAPLPIMKKIFCRFNPDKKGEVERVMSIPWADVEAQIEQLAIGRDPTWKYGQKYLLDLNTGKVTVIEQ